ncbi:LacI family DNA-binding transcriptional regulator [Georgenia sp. M64]|uniref:LacI family DNA-binding transcriptional regulator n=1 Tax=Georgenia sp. M64 TaxID=3120520 RepID=UPI0030E25D04
MEDEPEVQVAASTSRVIDGRHGEVGRATIRDVAAKAGVSSATVSRVLNGAGAGAVHARTRDRVVRAIFDLGFEPSHAARALATRRSHTIGILTLAEIFSPASLSFVLQSAVQDAGYHVSVATIPSLEAATKSSFSRLDPFREAEGLIALAPTRESERALAAMAIGVPTIVVEGAGHGALPSITMDQQGGAALVTEHLIEQGARRIAHIAGPEDWPSAEQRRAGWLEALQRHGLQVGLSVRGDWSVSSGYRAARELIDGADVDALFVANDRMAIGALSALADTGVSVPDDVLVVGFDNTEESGYLRPRLTTVQQDYHKLGQEAVADLVALLHGEDRAQAHRVLPVELIVRDSSRRSTGRP